MILVPLHQVLEKLMNLSHSVNIGIRYARAVFMQGDLHKFNASVTATPTKTSK